MGKGEGGEENGLTRQSNLYPRTSMGSFPQLLKGQREDTDCSLGTPLPAHQVLQNPGSRGEAV